MKITGIILVVLGTLSLIGTFWALANGHSRGSLGGVAFIVLGAFLISRAEKKKKELEEKKKWEERQ